MCNDNNPRRIDPCMVRVIEILNKVPGYATLGCCCGHNKYPMTIVGRQDGIIYELMTGIHIPRKRRFYRKDSEGYYYIPEIMEAVI